MYYLQFSNRKYKDQRIVLCIKDKPPIDPEETKLKVKPLFQRTDEFKKQQELSDKKIGLYKEQHDLNRQYNLKVNPKTGKFRGPNAEKIKIQTEYQRINKKLAVLEQDLIGHSKLTDQAYQNLFQENAIYSAPRNAILLDREQAKLWTDLIGNLKANELLLEDKTVVTREQLNAERIANLTEYEKEYEKRDELSRALNQSVKMRSELEITGEDKPLEKAQKWFQTEKAKIEEQYT